MDSGKAKRFNRGGICVTLGRRSLVATIDRGVAVPAFRQKLIVTHLTPLSNVLGFVPSAALAEMLAIAGGKKASARCSQTNLNLVHSDEDCPTTQLNALTKTIKP